MRSSTALLGLADADGTGGLLEAVAAVADQYHAEERTDR